MLFDLRGRRKPDPVHLRMGLAVVFMISLHRCRRRRRRRSGWLLRRVLKGGGGGQRQHALRRPDQGCAKARPARSQERRCLAGAGQVRLPARQLQRRHRPGRPDNLNDRGQQAGDRGDRCLGALSEARTRASPNSTTAQFAAQHLRVDRRCDGRAQGPADRGRRLLPTAATPGPSWRCSPMRVRRRASSATRHRRRRLR